MDKLTAKERGEHMLAAIQLIKEFVAGMDEKSFVNDLKIQSAVQYQFLIIGEAIRYIDDAVLAKYTYPWHIPRSFRNFIIHEIPTSRSTPSAHDHQGFHMTNKSQQAGPAHKKWIYEYHEVKMERIFFATQDLDELEKQILLLVKNEF